MIRAKGIKECKLEIPSLDFFYWPAWHIVAFYPSLHKQSPPSPNETVNSPRLPPQHKINAANQISQDPWWQSFVHPTKRQNLSHLCNVLLPRGAFMQVT